MTIGPDWLIFSVVVVFLSFIMYAGYVWGLEVGLNKGHRIGFDLGKSVGRREFTDRGINS